MYSTDNTENANPSRRLVRGEEKEGGLSNKSGSHSQRALAQRWQQMPCLRDGVQAVLHHTEASSQNSTRGGFVPTLSIPAGVLGAAVPWKYPLKAPGVIAALKTSCQCRCEWRRFQQYARFHGVRRRTMEQKTKLG